MLFLQIKFTGLWLSFFYLCIIYVLFIIKFIFQETSSIFIPFYFIFKPCSFKKQISKSFFTLILSKN